MKEKKKEKRIFLPTISGIISIALMIFVLAFSVEAQAQDESKIFGIMYHQVLKDESRHNNYVISPDELEADFKYFAENNFTALLPSELCDMVRNNRRIPEKAVMITFDDGYETMMEYVLPLLYKYKLRATVNIVGEYADSFTNTPENEKNLSFSYLTWDEIKELSDTGIVEIGNHTNACHNADENGIAKRYNESDMQFHQRIFDDAYTMQEKIRNATGITPIAFAYPFGNMPDGTESVIRKTGIELFMSCREIPTAVTSLPIILGRYNRAHNVSAETLYKRFVGE